jgi:hypothetical protein
MFPDFGERTVEIIHCHKIFIVPKLSILQYSQAIKIINDADLQLQNRLGDAALRDISDRACGKLWVLLETFLPEKILLDRDMFDYNDLVELCMYLAFGSYLDNKLKEHGPKYYEPPTQPDYQFKAARILSRFSAYTLEKLLNEPASIFFALSDYVDRITADNAIELIAAGVKAAFANFDQLVAKRGSLTIPNPNCTQRDISLEGKQEIKEFLDSCHK